MCISSAFQWWSPFVRAKSISNWTMTYSGSYGIYCLCVFHRYVCWQLCWMVSQLGQPENYSVCTKMHEMWAVKVVCDAKATPRVINIPHWEYENWSPGFSFMWCLVVMQAEGWTILCSLTNKMQDMNQHYHISHVEPWNLRNSSIYIPSSRQHLSSLFLSY